MVVYLHISINEKTKIMKNLTIQSAVNEIKVLNAKRQPLKNYMQGLTAKEYDRINSLHSFLISTNEGLNALYSNGILTK